MLTIVVSIFIFSLAYIAWDILKYNKQIKNNERYNRESLKEVYKKEKKSKSSTKVSKAKVQSKRKPGRPKKQTKK